MLANGIILPKDAQLKNLEVTSDSSLSRILHIQPARKLYLQATCLLLSTSAAGPLDQLTLCLASWPVTWKVIPSQGAICAKSRNSSGEGEPVQQVWRIRKDVQGKEVETMRAGKPDREAMK